MPNRAMGEAVSRSTLVLEYDGETHQVIIGGDPMPISLAQMICGEAQRVMDEKRRAAAAMMLQREIAANGTARAIAERALRHRS